MKGGAGWKCGRCGNSFKPKHHLRAVCHYAKIAGNGIAICPSLISQDDAKRYRALYDSFLRKKDARKRGHDNANEYIIQRQEGAVEQLVSKRSRAGESITAQVGIDTTDARMNTLGFAVVGMSRSRVGIPSNQPSIDAAVQNMTQTDIRISNNARLQMAIASLWHEDNIADVIVESQRFALVLKYARLVGDDFKIPNRKMIGGSLLDINYKNCYSLNKVELLKEASIFGLTWLGDGATIKQMPFVNCLAISGSTLPIVVAIQDCTDHMASGGKKDAPYIAKLFEDRVEEYDRDKKFTDIFYFDGASNVQKAGRLLVAKCPRAYSFHGGEHVISLFFTSLSKMTPIKVCFGLGVNFCLRSCFTI